MIGQLLIFVYADGPATMLFVPSTMQEWQEWMHPLRNIKEARNWSIGRHVELSNCRRVGRANAEPDK